MKSVNFLFSFGMLICLSPSASASTPNIYKVPESAIARDNSYNDWSNAERWQLAVSLDKIAERQRFEKEFCQFQYDPCSFSMQESVAHSEYGPWFANNLNTSTSPMCMVQQPLCQQVSQVDAMKKRSKAIADFERSLVEAPEYLESDEPLLDVTTLFSQLTNHKYVPAFLRNHPTLMAVEVAPVVNAPCLGDNQHTDEKPNCEIAFTSTLLD
jgi:hypothetical protein